MCNILFLSYHHVRRANVVRGKKRKQFLFRFKYFFSFEIYFILLVIVSKAMQTVSNNDRRLCRINEGEKKRIYNKINAKEEAKKCALQFAVKSFHFHSLFVLSLFFPFMLVVALVCCRCHM